MGILYNNAYNLKINWFARRREMIMQLRMPGIILTLIIGILGIDAMLVGCGKKGSLTMPTEQPSTPSQAEQTSEKTKKSKQ